MINNDRIVPVTKIDLLSLYAFILAQAGTTIKVIAPATSNGDFAPTDTSGNLVLSQPAKRITVADGAAVVIYFVGAYGYEGFFDADNEPLTIAEGSAEVLKDAATLYAANISSGTVTIQNVMTAAADFT